MADTNRQIEQLKQKYGSVFRTIEQHGVSLSRVDMQDGKLFVEGVAPSEEARDRVWDQIKLVNPSWQHELICDIRSERTQNAGNTGQTSVQTAHESEQRVLKRARCETRLTDLRP